MRENVSSVYCFKRITKDRYLIDFNKKRFI